MKERVVGALQLQRRATRGSLTSSHSMATDDNQRGLHLFKNLCVISLKTILGNRWRRRRGLAAMLTRPQLYEVVLATRALLCLIPRSVVAQIATGNVAKRIGQSCVAS